MVILISGSRSLKSDQIRLRLEKYMDRMWYEKHTLIVGDAPGVDREAIELAHTYEVPTLVFIPSILDNPRSTSPSANYIFIDGDYTARDREMVRQADMICCFWDGKSKGTKAVFDYATKLGKSAHLEVFN